MEGRKLSGECSSRDESSDGEGEVAEEKESRYWEFAQQSDAGGNNVKGRLRSNVGYWENVVIAPSPIISIIKQGYILPFVSVPSSRWFQNQRSHFLCLSRLESWWTMGA